MTYVESGDNVCSNFPEENGSGNLDCRIKEIFDILTRELFEANSANDKKTVYLKAADSYKKLRGESWVSVEQMAHIDRMCKYIDSRIVILDRLSKSREGLSESSADQPEITWMDDRLDIYMLNFCQRLPDVASKYSENPEDFWVYDSDPSKGLSKKIQLIGKLKDLLISEKRTIESSLARGTSVDRSQKPSPKDKLKVVKKFLKQFAVMEPGLLSAKKAYDRFNVERADIEKDLLGRIKTVNGEDEFHAKVNEKDILVSKSVPYLMFVNKAGNAQYAVFYKYDADQQKLNLKSFNLISSGSPTRYGDNHTTASKVFYSEFILSPKRPEYGKDYGSEHVDSDDYAYKVFELSYPKTDPSSSRTKMEGFQYFMHLTPEEEKLGTRQSHGCIRMPRLLNMDVFETYFRVIYENHLRIKSADSRGLAKDFSNPKDSQFYMESNFKMPIVVADYLKDKYGVLVDEYSDFVKKAGRQELSASEQAISALDLKQRFLQVAAAADESIAKIQTGKADSLSIDYYKKIKNDSLIFVHNLSVTLDALKSSDDFGSIRQ